MLAAIVVIVMGTAARMFPLWKSFKLHKIFTHFFFFLCDWLISDRSTKKGNKQTNNAQHGLDFMVYIFGILQTTEN